MANVAFLGLGVMGFPMAGHLLTRGGHDVTVYNRTPARARDWLAKFPKGKSAPTPAAAAKEQGRGEHRGQGSAWSPSSARTLAGFRFRAAQSASAPLAYVR